MVPVHNERVAVKHGRTAFTVRVQRLHLAEVGLPFHRAVRVEAVKSARAEEGVKELAIGGRRVRGWTARVVPSFVRPFLAHDAFPQHAPIAPAHRQHHVLIRMRDRHAVMHARRGVMHRLLLFADWRRGHHVNAVAEHNGRGMSLARKFNLPPHVLLLAPLDGWVRIWRDAVRQRTAPLRPVVRALRRRRCEACSRTNEKDDYQWPQQPSARVRQGHPSAGFRRGLEIAHTTAPS